MPSPLYQRYVDRYRLVARALEAGDAEPLRQLELELPTLPPVDQRITRMAIHDVVRKVPMSGPPHFERVFAVGAR